MKNPYKVLNISQDASSQEIIRAQALAMRARNFSPREIAEARSILSKPASRLAADFTFPIFPKVEDVKLIVATVSSKNFTVDMCNPNKYDSL